MQETIRVDRWRYVGGSDVPAIMNISSFKTRWELLQEKAQLTEDSFIGNVYTEYGNIMEPKIREWVNDNRNFGFIEGRHYDEDKHFRVHTDGEDEVRETVLEVKTTSEIYESLTDYKTYLVQLLFNMYVAGFDNGLLAVYARPEDFNEELDPDRLQLFTVKMSDHKDLMKEILTAVDRFQIDTTRLREDPLLNEEDFIPKDLVLLSNAYLALEETLETYNKIKAQADLYKEKLFEFMRDEGVKTWRTPRGTLITRIDEIPAHMETVEELDMKSLKRDLPELFKSDFYGGYMVTKEAQKPGRKGYVKTTKAKET